METNSRYLEASFISFFIHAIIILFMLGFFYNENPERSIISKPINVNLIFMDFIFYQKRLRKASLILLRPSRCKRV